MTENNRQKRGIETRDVASGFNAVFHRGDGTAMKVWGRSERAARQKLHDRMERRGINPDEVGRVEDDEDE